MVHTIVFCHFGAINYDSKNWDWGHPAQEHKNYPWRLICVAHPAWIEMQIDRSMGCSSLSARLSKRENGLITKDCKIVFARDIPMDSWATVLRKLSNLGYSTRFTITHPLDWEKEFVSTFGIGCKEDPITLDKIDYSTITKDIIGGQ